MVRFRTSVIHALLAVTWDWCDPVAAGPVGPGGARHFDRDTQAISSPVTDRIRRDTPSRPEPVILQPLRVPRQGNSKRDRRTALELKGEETLYWGAEDGTVARLRIETPDETENLVNLELIDDMVRQVACPPAGSESGTLKLQFLEEADFDDAQDIWQWVNQAADNRFLLLVGAGACGWNTERIPYNVTGLVYNDEVETAVLKVQRTTWKEAAHTFDLTIGHTALPPTTNNNNNNNNTTLSTTALALNPAFTIPLATNLTSPETLTIPLPNPAGGAGTPPLTLSATCLDCHTSGSLTVQAHFAARWFQLTAAAVEVSLPSELTATAVLGLSLKGTVVDAVTGSVPLFELAPGGVAIPGVVTLGPTVGVSLGVEVGGVRGAVGVTVGGTAVVEGGSVARLDFLERGDGRTGVEGWGVQVRGEELRVDASVEARAAVFLRAAVGVEVSVFESGFAAEVRADAPTLSATLKAATYADRDSVELHRVRGVPEISWHQQLYYQNNAVTNEGDDLLQFHLERLGEEAAKYWHSSVPTEMGCPWSCSHDMSKFLQAACRCASLVYDYPSQPSFSSGLELQPIMQRTPSVTGMSKATSMWKTVSEHQQATLFVSVRGTASTVDHVVNSNGEPRDVGPFFKFEGIAGTKAHTGFLACAKALIPTLKAAIEQHVTSDKRVFEVVFTGHSAGGAVASLVFLHFVSNPSAEHNCKRLPQVNVVLALVNEYDLVTRADKPYLNSLVDLYRSRYGLPPLHTPTLSSLAAHTGAGGGKGMWPLPPPQFQLLGDVIVLKSCAEPAGDDESDATKFVHHSLQAVQLTADEFGRLLFCDVAVHRRVVYLERMDMLTRVDEAPGPAEGKGVLVMEREELVGICQE
ncbi:hypothetical protein F5144DRAFT_617854 [Chaetomium tenue]|uniref:Uncharacterized protein n=1 Tax=Chaetomium tenue TaxID=1854479 RepID=A0ACB7PRV0_9PEZI|nr:hypothetical protein F5144DRAFT_617854 [Chaetomium globosum]